MVFSCPRIIQSPACSKVGKKTSDRRFSEANIIKFELLPLNFPNVRTQYVISKTYAHPYELMGNTMYLFLNLRSHIGLCLVQPTLWPLSQVGASLTRIFPLKPIFYELLWNTLGQVFESLIPYDCVWSTHPSGHWVRLGSVWPGDFPRYLHFMNS